MEFKSSSRVFQRHLQGVPTSSGFSKKISKSHKIQEKIVKICLLSSVEPTSNWRIIKKNFTFLTFYPKPVGKPSTQCLKITEKVSFNIASEASYIYIISGQKLIKNAKNGPIWRVFENLKLAVKQSYQTGQF